ncbi:MAG: hypothetical protein HQK60_08380 [Deltaproteobacteria bacterium]|nr:hypothetical protein [Deltaproteobacteria bacterium]
MSQKTGKSIASRSLLFLFPIILALSLFFILNTPDGFAQEHSRVVVVKKTSHHKTYVVKKRVYHRPPRRVIKRRINRHHKKVIILNRNNQPTTIYLAITQQSLNQGKV